MALQEEFREQGEWLFRWRSFLPLVLVPLIGIALSQLEADQHLDKWNYVWDYTCLGISFVGLFVRVITVGFVPGQTSGRNTREQVADQLNTTGIYSTVRHPLYLGNFLIGLGVALVQAVWWLPVIYTLTFWLYYERIMFAEEAFLRHKFRETYRRWAAVTPAFLPRFSQWRKPALPFSWINAVRREYSGLMILILCHAGQEFFERLITDRRVVWEVFWATLLFGGLATYFSVRWINRNTKLLRVPGR
jgi:protein-S-isoprenylcysteine O-methyltransferase Ste14